MKPNETEWPPVYFAGAISGGRGDVASYARIVARLTEKGLRVRGIHTASPDLAAKGESLDDATIYRRDVGWLEEVAREGGFILADVSQPSLGVGYEIATAKHRLGMPVFCLLRDDPSRRCSAMITGDPAVTVVRYTYETLEAAVDEVLVRVANKFAPGEVSGSRS